MGKVRDQLRAVRFHCRTCNERFQAEPDRIEDAPQDVWHPWRYFAACPTCRTEATQEHRERTLLKMWANATGPKTAEGKAAAAANLEGHPTPEEAVRTRFNALQHGLTAKVATYYPARPGRYPQCTGCEYIDTLCPTQTACLKRTELFLRHHVAFQTRNPALLVEVNADLQANVRALIEDMILSITQDGARLKSPKFYYDNDGGLHWVRMIDERTGEETPLYDISAHPLLKTLSDFLSKNAMSMADMMMTAKHVDEEETVRGYLAGQSAREESQLGYQARQTAALEGLADLIRQSRADVAADPVLIEHQSNGGDG
jgi:hypothetical protein